jgi:hypothetical protein
MKNSNILYPFLSIYLLFIFINQDLYAQVDVEQTEEVKIIKIGTKVGYSLGKLTDSNENIYTENYESVSGIDVGIFIEHQISTLTSIQAEINYTKRGGTRNGIQPITSDELSGQLNQFLLFIGEPLITDENPLYASFNNESDLSYLEFPVLFKMGWGDDFRFYTEIGPYVGILLSSRQYTKGTSQFYFDLNMSNPVAVPFPSGQLSTFIPLPEQSLNADTNTKDDLHIVNFGGIAGVGFIKSLNENSELLFNARASYSFTPIQIKEVFGESHIGGVIFSIGYAYKL